MAFSRLVVPRVGSAVTEIDSTESRTLVGHSDDDLEIRANTTKAAASTDDVAPEILIGSSDNTGDDRQILTNLKVGSVSISFDTRTIAEIISILTRATPTKWQTVVTPNLHHINLIEKDPELASIYSNAGIVLPDGWPVAWVLSRVKGCRVGRVAGSDLLELLLSADGKGKPLVLVGGRDEMAVKVVERRAKLAGWAVVSEPAPPSELANEQSRNALQARVAAAGTDGVVVLGLGAPKQEQFATALASGPGQGYILCLGMAINFSAGVMKRAPSWMQKAKIEWLHRILQERQRLLPRYVNDARSLVPLMINNVRSR
ncbi:N-acetylglucosaminyldiphosphoundecaprenol N-acetyl-beta-D-mannosaminyltransferase [Rhodococcus globerulus]|nr:N-acetylglucosaminyldiphosphoundecaprenol N-acetyl-beta-D-mannosaminyltransferase [Rhodococcus globerulus]